MFFVAAHAVATIAAAAAFFTIRHKAMPNAKSSVVNLRGEEREREREREGERERESSSHTFLRVEFTDAAAAVRKIQSSGFYQLRRRRSRRVGAKSTSSLQHST